MRITLLLVAALISEAFAFGEPGTDVQHEGSWTGPTFDRGYIIDWSRQDHGAYTLYAPDGTRLYSTSPAKLGIANTLVLGFAADTDGTVAAIYQVPGSPSPEGGILIIDPAGKPGLSIKTGIYLPKRICFADDHSLWTVGNEYGKEDFPVFRRLSRQGQQLGAFVPWSQIASGHNAPTALQGIVDGAWTLRAAKDRIGTFSFSDYETTKWIEVGLSGNLIGQWEWRFDGSASYFPVAFTSSNALYGQIWRLDHAAGYAIFDRRTNSWKEVTGYPKGRLLGADQDELVFSEEDGGSTVLHRVPSSALHVKTDGN